ncbi:unnamed protein product [Dicrocoelium dendriticum]|nr:unnamed protein product [Dicrocoelium dendriticum]
MCLPCIVCSTQLRAWNARYIRFFTFKFLFWGLQRACVSHCFVNTWWKIAQWREPCLKDFVFRITLSIHLLSNSFAFYDLPPTALNYQLLSCSIEFFPGPLERWVAVPSNLIYYVFLRSKICPGIERHSEIISTASFAENIPGITSDDERHRRIAIKALNERLFSTQLQSTEPVAWPNLEENEVTAITPSSQSESQVAVQSVVVTLPTVSSSETV